MTRRTKLVCTIGPASVGRVGELVTAGLDVARINCSHGTPASRRAAVEAVREAAAAADRPIAILADLAGPKIRLAEFPSGAIELAVGDPFELRTGQAGEPGGTDGAGVTHEALAQDLVPGDRVLLADGAVELRVVGTVGDVVRAAVVAGGTVRSRAGVSIPSERFSGPALTPKDLVDIEGLLDLGVDYIAQSFVRRAADVAELRDRLGSSGPPVVAKIETRPAVDEIETILDVADAVMIARGDLGVELPFEEVPLVQKRLVRLALERGIPALVATQMLESMVAAPRPTRAEASDVANAVFDGADAILLSAETAIGAYPILATEAAVRICGRAEERARETVPDGVRRPQPGGSEAVALAQAAVDLSRGVAGIAGIACYTRTGRTARVLAARRPPRPIYAVTPDAAVARRLALVHGVRAMELTVPEHGASDRLTWLVAELRQRGFIESNAAVVAMASTAQPGTGPTLLAIDRPRSG